MKHPLLEPDDELWWKFFVWFETVDILAVIVIGIVGYCVQR